MGDQPMTEYRQLLDEVPSEQPPGYDSHEPHHVGCHNEHGHTHPVDCECWCHGEYGQHIAYGF